MAYFILGFISVTFLKLPILAVALCPAIALIDFFNTQRGAAEATARPAPQEDAEDGI